MTLFAHNACPLCHVENAPQTRGSLSAEGGEWVEMRTCSSCKKTYKYKPVIVGNVYGRNENGKWVIVSPKTDS